MDQTQTTSLRLKVLLGVLALSVMGAATFTALPSAVVADTIADALQLDRRSYTSGGRGFVYVERFSSTTAPWAEPRKLFYEAGSTRETNGVNSNVVFAATGGRLVFRDCFSGHPVDATWFGASDSPALSVTSHAQIQAALDFVNARTNSAGNRVGGTVKLPAGVYAISSTITLRPRVNLVGEHSHYSDANYITASVTNTTYAAGGSVQIVLLGNSNVPVFTNDPTDPELFPRQSGEPQEDGSVADSKQYSMLLKGLTVYVASQTKYDCHILKLYHAWGVRVEDCYFWTRFGHSVWLKDCNAFKAINSRFIGGSFTEGARGILMWGTGDSKLVDCELGGMVGPGVWITGSSAGKDTLIGNQIFNQQRHRQQITGYDTSTDTITLSAPHLLETGMLAEWTKEAGATPTTNLNQWQPYWVIKVSTNSLKLATTESNALAGVAIDLTGSIAGTNYIWSGPGASLYGSWAAENMVVVGNRFEQNQESGIYLSDAPGWEIGGNMCYYNQYDNVGGAKDPISVPNIYLRGNNVGTIIQGNSLDADSVRYGPDYGIQVADNSAGFIASRVILGPNGIRKSVVQDYVLGTNNHHAIVTRYSTNESSGYSGIFLSRIETVGAKMGNTNSGSDITIPLELQTPASGVPVLTARRLSFPKLGIRITGTGMGAGNQNGFLFMNEEEGYFGASLAYSTNSSTLRLGGTGAFQNHTRDAEIAGDIGGTTDLPSRKIYFRPPLGTGAGASNNAGHVFQLAAGGSSGATAHSLYDAVRIGANGSTPASGQTPLELLDYGSGTMSRVKVSSGPEKALYIGTEPTFGGGGGGSGISTNGGAPGYPIVLNSSLVPVPTNSLDVSNLTADTLNLTSPIPASSLTNAMATDAEVAAAYVPNSRMVSGANSVTGGGDLSGNLALSLVNDSATPGASKYYGTDGAGTKGYFSLPGFGGSPLALFGSNGTDPQWIEPSNGFRLHDEFLNYSSSGLSGQHDWSPVVNSGSIGTIAAETNGPGLLIFSTLTSASAAPVLTCYTSAIRFGGGRWIVEARVKTPASLSDGTDTYEIRAGFLDSTTSTLPVDAAMLYYRHDIAGGNWAAWNSANSVSNVVDTGVSVVADTWVKLKIDVSGDANSAVYSINGTPVVTNSSSIPTGSGRALGLALQLVKSAGTAARTIKLDRWTTAHLYNVSQ